MTESQQSTTIVFRITNLFVFGNAVASAYRARADPYNLAFVLFAYGTLMALLLCIHLLEKRQAAAEKAEGLKAAVWALSTALTVGFAWRVGNMMPLAVAAAIWAFAIVFSAFSFYVLILYRSLDEAFVNGEEKDDKKVLSPEEQV